MKKAISKVKNREWQSTPEKALEYIDTNYIDMGIWNTRKCWPGPYALQKKKFKLQTMNIILQDPGQCEVDNWESLKELLTQHNNDSNEQTMTKFQHGSNSSELQQRKMIEKCKKNEP